MKDEIVTYREMCDRENRQTMQRGMNYRCNPSYSVFLMSQRTNAPYDDRVHPDGFTIEYEGHDTPKTVYVKNPKKVDQPLINQGGTLTQNGLFVQAIKDFKKGDRSPEIIRVYEKIFSGIWSEKGFFKLLDFKNILKEGRKIYRFILEETDFKFKTGEVVENSMRSRSRIIPSAVKKIVWARDKGMCVLCGEKDELHFDHDLPFSKGGTSIDAKNVKILCARHNLSKSDKIE